MPQKGANFARLLVDAISLVAVAFCVHQADAVLRGAIKLATGCFGYVSVYRQTFGIAQVVVFQTGPLTSLQRLAIYGLPAAAYLIVLAGGLCIDSRLGDRFRLIRAWAIVASAGYALHDALVGAFFQGGPLGALEAQLGHPGVAWTLLTLLLVTLGWSFRLRLRARPQTSVAAFALALLVGGVFLNYRLLHLTCDASLRYKSAITCCALLVVAWHGTALRLALVPRSAPLRLALVAGTALYLIASPGPYRFSASRYASILQQPPTTAFPPVPTEPLPAGTLLVAEENRHRVLTVDRQGQIHVLADQVPSPETLFVDQYRQRLVVGGAADVRTYDLTRLDAAANIITPWRNEPIECLIADRTGLIVGYLPDQVARIDEQGNLQPLLEIESPDSLAIGSDNGLLIGTTRAAEPPTDTPSLMRYDLVSGHREPFQVEGTLDNIEALVPLPDGTLLVGLGSMHQRGTAQVGIIDRQRQLNTLVAVADVEGLCLLANGEVAFSNDELSTVFVISTRGGIYPLAHLFDPDDLTALP
jgi:hypothetical protein